MMGLVSCLNIDGSPSAFDTCLFQNPGQGSIGPSWTRGRLGKGREREETSARSHPGLASVKEHNHLLAFAPGTGSHRLVCVSLAPSIVHVLLTTVTSVTTWEPLLLRMRRLLPSSIRFLSPGERDCAGGVSVIFYFQSCTQLGVFTRPSLPTPPTPSLLPPLPFDRSHIWWARSGLPGGKRPKVPSTPLKEFHMVSFLQTLPFPGTWHRSRCSQEILTLPQQLPRDMPAAPPSLPPTLWIIL